MLSHVLYKVPQRVGASRLSFGNTPHVLLDEFPESGPADREAINREMPLVAEYDTKRDEVKRAVHMLWR